MALVLRLAGRALAEKGVFLQLRNAEIGITTPLVRIDGANLRTANAPPFLSVESAELTTTWVGLVTGDTQDLRVKLRRPRFFVRFDRNGKTNLPSTGTGRLDANVIQALEVSGASLLLEEEGSGFRAELNGIALNVLADRRTKSDRIEAAASGESFLSWQGRRLPLSGLKAKAVFARRNLMIDGLDLKAGQSALSLQANVPVEGPQEYRLRLKADLHNQEALRFLGAGTTITGLATGELQANGREGKWAFQALLSGSNLHPSWPHPATLKADARLEEAGGKMSIGSLEMRSAGIDAALGGELAWRGGRTRTGVKIRKLELDLGRLSQAAGLGARVAGRFTSNGELQIDNWDWRTLNGHLTGPFSVRQGDAVAGTAALSGSLRGEMSQGTARLLLEGMEAPGARLSGDIQIDAGTLEMEGRVAGTITEPAQLAAAAAQLLGRDVVNLPVEGAMEFDATAGGSIPNPDIRATLRAEQLQVAGLAGFSLRGAGRYLDRAIVIDSLQVGKHGQMLEAHGRLETGRLELEARMQNARLEQLLLGTGIETAAGGSVDAQVKVGGTAGAPEAHVHLRAQDLRILDEPVAGVEAGANYSGALLTMPAFRLEKTADGSGGALEASGQLNLASMAFSLTARSEALKLDSLRVADGLRLQGRLRLDAVGEGTLDDPRLEANLKASEVSFGGRRLEEVTAHTWLKEHVAEVHVQVPRYATTMHGTVMTASPCRSHLKVEMEGTRIALPGDVSAALSGMVAAQGDLLRPEAAEAHADLRELVLRLRDAELRNTSPLLARLNNGAVTVAQAKFAGKGAEITLAGSVPLSVTGPGPGLEASGELDLGLLAELFPELGKHTVQGTARLAARVGNSLESPAVSGSLHVSGGRWGTPWLKEPLEQLTAEVTLDDQGITLRSAEGRLGQGSIRVSGEIPREMLGREVRRPARLSVEAKQINASPAGDTSTEFTSRVSLTAEAEADRISVEALRGRVEVTELELRRGNHALSNRGPMRISLAEGIATLDDAQLQMAESGFRLGGKVALASGKEHDLKVSGDLNLSLFSPQKSPVSFAGPATVELNLRGRGQVTDLTGFVQVRDGEFNLLSPPLRAQEIQVRADLRGGMIQITDLRAEVNGGNLAGSGSLAFGGAGLASANLQVKADEVFLNFPKGLQTVSDADLSLRSEGANFLLDGKITISDGSYRDPFTLKNEIIQALVGESSPGTGRAGADPLSRLRFNVAIQTQQPLLLKNSLVDLDVRADMRVIGTAARPVVTGKLIGEPGGRIYLQGNTFVAERGSISFANEARTEPNFDIAATTRSGQYDITMLLSGTMKDFRSSWTSTPVLSQEDIYSVLLTGKKVSEGGISGGDLAGRQTVALLGADLGGRVTGRVGYLSSTRVRVEPSLIAAEARPGARLTVGQDITRELELTYSVNLTDSTDQIWIVEYDLRRRFNMRAIKQTDNTYRGEARHDVRFGGGSRTGEPKKPPAGPKVRVASISFGGATVIPEAELRKKLKLQPGGQYTTKRLRASVEKLEALHRDKGYFEAQVRRQTRASGNSVDVEFLIRPGPRVRFVYEGTSAGEIGENALRRVWSDGLFDSQRIDRVNQLLWRKLSAHGWLQAQRSCTVNQRGPETKEVLIEVRRGVRFKDVRIAFPGLAESRDKQLRNRLESGGLVKEIHTEPERVTAAVTAFLSEQGLLRSKVDAPRYEYEPASGKARVAISVTEGPVYRVAAIRFKGNEGIPDSELLKNLATKLGEVHRATSRAGLRDSLEEEYWRRGYRDVEVVSLTEELGPDGGAKLLFKIDEGRQSVIAGVHVEGTVYTSGDFIQRQLGVEQGQVYDYLKTNRGRTKLYDSGGFDVVEITPSAIEETSAPRQGPMPVDLLVRVREPKPFRVVYGALYDTERKWGFILDLENRNMLGEARSAGLRFRYDKQTREQRIYFNQPFFLTRRIRTTVDVARQQQFVSVYEGEKYEGSIQQEVEFRKRFLFSYGYRIGWGKVTARIDDTDLKVSGSSAPLFTSLLRDTRDDVLNAKKGSYASTAFEATPGALGGDLRYSKFFSQYSKYFTLRTVGDPTNVRPDHMNKFVYAGSVRLGLIHPFEGTTILPTTRFFAGGGTTIRGYEQNSVGPTLPDGSPAGGNALFILNNEIRLPVWRRFSGAAFVDTGNVYQSVSDFDLSGLRTGIGFGLRFHVSYIVLRLDYGWKVGRKPGESPGEFFFSIGQAF